MEQEEESNSVNNDAESDEEEVIELSESESEDEVDTRHLKGAKTHEEITFGLPPRYLEGRKALDVADRKSELTGDKMDVINATIHNTSDDHVFSDTPFILCSPQGLKWISEKMGDPQMLQDSLRCLNDVHIASFEMFRTAMNEIETPTPLIPEMLKTCVPYFKSLIRCFGIMSDEEIDTLVRNELSKPTSLKNTNGLAEKTVLHCIVAIGLMSIADHPDAQSPLKFDVSMSSIFRHINTANYYFFRFMMIGNSLMGVKAACLLAQCMSFSVFTTPSMGIASLSVRLAQLGRYHTREGCQRADPVETERLRRLWWLIYEEEKFLTMRLGKPSCIVEETITTPMPTYTPELDDLTHCNTNGDTYSFAKGHAELFRIWTKLFDVMCVSKQSRYNKLVTFVQIDQELEKWSNARPNFRKPGMIDEYISKIPNINNMDRWHLKFFLIKGVASFGFMKTTIFRFISYHPSWIYKVVSKEKTSETPEMCSTESEFDNSPHHRDSVMNELFASKNKDTGPADQRTWVEKYNGVKLVTKQVAIEHPILLNSFAITSVNARETMRVALKLDGSRIFMFSFGIVVLNAFVTILIKCMMLPNDPETDNDMQLLFQTASFLNRSRIVCEIIHKDLDFVKVMTDSISRYIKRVRSCTFYNKDGNFSTTIMSPPCTGANAPLSNHQVPRNNNVIGNGSSPLPRHITPQQMSNTPANSYAPQYDTQGRPDNNNNNQHSFLHDNDAAAQYDQISSSAGADSTGNVPYQWPGMTFEDLLMQPKFPDDPNIFDGLYQLSSVWGNWDPSETSLGNLNGSHDSNGNI